MTEVIFNSLAAFGRTVEELNSSALIGKQWMFARTPDIDDVTLVGLEQTMEVLAKSDEVEVPEEEGWIDTGLMFFFGGTVAEFLEEGGEMLVRFTSELRSEDNQVLTETVKITPDTLVAEYPEELAETTD